MMTNSPLREAPLEFVSAYLTLALRGQPYHAFEFRHKKQLHTFTGSHPNTQPIKMIIDSSSSTSSLINRKRGIDETKNWYSTPMHIAFGEGPTITRPWRRQRTHHHGGERIGEASNPGPHVDRHLYYCDCEECHNVSKCNTKHVHKFATGATGRILRNNQGAQKPSSKEKKEDKKERAHICHVTECTEKNHRHIPHTKQFNLEDDFFVEIHDDENHVQDDQKDDDEEKEEEYEDNSLMSPAEFEEPKAEEKNFDELLDEHMREVEKATLTLPAQNSSTAAASTPQAGGPSDPPPASSPPAASAPTPEDSVAPQPQQASGPSVASAPMQESEKNEPLTQPQSTGTEPKLEENAPQVAPSAPPPVVVTQGPPPALRPAAITQVAPSAALPAAINAVTKEDYFSDICRVVYMPEDCTGMLTKEAPPVNILVRHNDIRAETRTFEVGTVKTVLIYTRATINCRRLTTYEYFFKRRKVEEEQAITEWRTFLQCIEDWFDAPTIQPIYAADSSYQAYLKIKKLRLKVGRDGDVARDMLKNDMVLDLIGNYFNSVMQAPIDIRLFGALMNNAEMMNRTALSPNGIVRTNLIFTINAAATLWDLEHMKTTGKRLDDQLRSDTIIYVFQQKYIQGLRQQAQMPIHDPDTRPLNANSSAPTIPRSGAKS